MDDIVVDRLTKILDRLVTDGELKAALLHDKDGVCIASSGDGDSMTMVANTHFGRGLELSHLCRDACGSTVLSQHSGDAVRLESVALRYILIFVVCDPLIGKALRLRVDVAKRELARVLVRGEDVA